MLAAKRSRRQGRMSKHDREQGRNSDVAVVETARHPVSEPLQPRQEQTRQPGRESEMRPRPDYRPLVAGSGRLRGKVAVITGGDSGIGRAVAVAMAREGADIAILYLEEHKDAAETTRLVEEEGTSAIRIAGDIGDEAFCREAIDQVLDEFGQIDILVNNAAEQHETEDLAKISSEQIDRTFRTNIYSCFYMTKYALPHMKRGASIINTASVVAYKGHKTLLDYSATKGAVVAFTRSVSLALSDKGIRVNAVAPGPIWTPLIPASFDSDKVAQHGSSAEMERAGQPNEVAPCFVFLASPEASYISGQVLHPNGGVVLNS
jgi:NAD(P)-dependent dehydrogenase (short-subunit alcohol dehydrogenase family)